LKTEELVSKIDYIVDRFLFLEQREQRKLYTYIDELLVRLRQYEDPGYHFRTRLREDREQLYVALASITCASDPIKTPLILRDWTDKFWEYRQKDNDCFYNSLMYDLGGEG
jgi:hypothetical protein